MLLFSQIFKHRAIFKPAVKKQEVHQHSNAPGVQHHTHIFKHIEQWKNKRSDSTSETRSPRACSPVRLHLHRNQSTLLLQDTWPVQRCGINMYCLYHVLKSTYALSKFLLVGGGIGIMIMNIMGFSTYTTLKSTRLITSLTMTIRWLTTNSECEWSTRNRSKPSQNYSTTRLKQWSELKESKEED